MNAEGMVVVEKPTARRGSSRYVVPALFAIALMVLSVLLTSAGRDYCLAVFDSGIPGVAVDLDHRAP
jgi:hypothetical protein